MPLLAANTEEKKHGELDDEFPSPPGGGSPQPGLECSHTIQKAPASSFAVPALCIKKRILSYSSAPSVGSKLIQKKRKLHDASFLPSVLDSKFLFLLQAFAVCHIMLSPSAYWRCREVSLCAFYRVTQCKASQMQRRYLGRFLIQLSLLPFLPVRHSFLISLSWCTEMLSVLRIGGEWLERITKGEASQNAPFAKAYFSGTAQKMILEVGEKCHKKLQTVTCASVVNNSIRNQLCSFPLGVS